MPQLTKIGVFYDGNYFLHVSNYYNYDHPQRRRLSITGLHEFIEARVAMEEGIARSRSKIVDSHYFRGRLNATEAQQRGSALYYDRVFDDILMSSGVTTHYSPLRSSHGRRHEKGIDVWFALEAFEQTMLRRFDVVVLIASDGDYVPLVRKLNGLGCRVMIVGWDFEFTTDSGSGMITRTSQDLLAEASYPLAMSSIIDHPSSDAEAKLVDKLFVSEKKKETVKEERKSEPVAFEEPVTGDIGEVMESQIFSLKGGYGFITYPPNNLFFHHSNVKNVRFEDLLEGDPVEFTLTHSSKGKLVAQEVYFLGELEGEDYEQE
ncbi:cold-shock-like DNA binding protein [Neolewinella xylanilytica]|uniref:Cold-shock-like DNA binding protein n=1 Tax=Neolewinella xylanilytica TaxID=1514080 RepID=A0A2S6I477_9BACT|nr:NYN domain-containing protein [Neolewinella xylanilytica]PPK85992.1 cold-shock-like DNA binding protein [Neolewinella xylanilytica]